MNFTDALLEFFRGVRCLFGRHEPCRVHPSTNYCHCCHCGTPMLRINGQWEVLP